MSIYLAATYTRLTEMQEYARRLRAAGHSILSRWIYGGHETHDIAGDTEKARFAREDLEDLDRADAVLIFTEFTGALSSGGRHVEFGYALAKGKRAIIVGERENLFHYAPGAEQVENFEEALKLLRKGP